MDLGDIFYPTPLFKDLHKILSRFVRSFEM